MLISSDVGTSVVVYDEKRELLRQFFFLLRQFFLTTEKENLLIMETCPCDVKFILITPSTHHFLSFILITPTHHSDHSHPLEKNLHSRCQRNKINSKFHTSNSQL